MIDVELGAVQERFADIVWDNEPLSTRELVALCEEHLKWKRTTTYTVLKKLCDKGIFKSENKMVEAVMSREEFYAIQSEQFVEDVFKGSLPAFIAAFANRKEISAKDLEAIRKTIDSIGKKEC